MDIRAEVSIRGFISRMPEQKSQDGEAFLLVTQIGQKFRRREEDGTFTLTGSAYIELAMLGKKAEEAFKDFTKGDDVVAIGEFTTRTFMQDGQRIERRQFRASRLLFDTSRARYTVERTTREPAFRRPRLLPWSSEPRNLAALSAWGGDRDDRTACPAEPRTRAGSRSRDR